MTTRRDERGAGGSGAPGQSREVNTLLHTLRGEHFRHSQNLRKSKAHLAAAAAHSYNDRSLPFSATYRFTQQSGPSREAEETTARPPVPIIRLGRLEHDYPRGPVPGPPPPKSWRGGHVPAGYDPAIDKTMSAFRRRALSVVFSHTPWSFGSSDVPLYESSPFARPALGAGDLWESPVPPLAQICLRVLLAEFPDAEGFRDELLPAIPSYFKRDILRYTAVHDPLPNTKLYPLFEPEGHADGELIVVGPEATLQRDILLRHSPDTPTRRDMPEEGEDRGEGPSTSKPSLGGADPDDAADSADEDSWEVESSSQEVAPPLTTLVVLDAPVPATTLFAFPLILTRIALVALPAPTPVHRLPRMCPLLEVLDLSYNPWLNEPPGGKGTVETETVAQRVEWEKWARLRVLGLRGCGVPPEVVARVNKGRWEEVEVVLEEHRTFRTSMSDVEAMMRGLRLTD
ncbi:hypothetical protein C8Q77DRAFT_1095364 [Trametes polyzona]|nr:hypothetical protein C8Q77DRAFT_1095364 [Trametes polyzona]